MAVNVLIVDDLAFIKIVLRDILEKAGFRVVGEASNGEEAIRVYLGQAARRRADGHHDARDGRADRAEEDPRARPQARVIICSALGPAAPDRAGHPARRQGFHRQALPAPEGRLGSQEGPRHHLMLRLPVAALLLCSAAAALFAQSAPGQPAAVQGQQAAALAPRDDRDRWNIGFSALEAGGLSPGNSYLAGAIPLLLRDSLSRLPWHTLGEAERASRQAGCHCTRSRVPRQEHRDRAQQARRRVLRGSGGEGCRARRGRAGPRCPARAREVLAGLDPSIVDVPSRKDLLIVEGTGEGKLFNPPSGSRGVFCDERGLDMLVGGSLAEVQGFLRLDLWAWDAARGRVVFSWREAGTRGQLYDSLRGGARACRARPWRSLGVAARETLPAACLPVGGRAGG